MELVRAVNDLGRIAEVWRRIEADVEAKRASVRATSTALDTVQALHRTHTADDAATTVAHASTDDPGSGSAEAASSKREEDQRRDDRVDSTIARAQAARGITGTSAVKKTSTTNGRSGSDSSATTQRRGRDGSGSASAGSSARSTRLPSLPMRTQSGQPSSHRDGRRGGASASGVGRQARESSDARKRGQTAAAQPRAGKVPPARAVEAQAFPPALESLMKQHQILMNKAVAATRDGKSAAAWTDFSDQLSRDVDVDEARTEVDSAYDRITSLLESISEADFAATAQPPCRETLAALCRLSAVHEVTTQCGAVVEAANSEVAARLEIDAVVSAARDRVATVATRCLVSSEQVFARCGAVASHTDAGSSSAVWLPLEVIGPGSRRHAEAAFAHATALAEADVAYTSIQELVDAANLQHQLQATVLQLEIEQQLTVILAGLACGGDFGLDGTSTAATDAQDLFVEVYRTICAMRGAPGPAFVHASA